MTIENAKITSTSITMRDHGCLTFWLSLEGDGWGCGYGGYCIGKGYLGADEFTAADGNGLVAMMEIMDVVGVDKWEDLKGKYCRVQCESWGSPIKIIGNLMKDRWFDISDFFKSRYSKEKE